MIEFSSTNKGIPLQFDETEPVQLCPRCGTPNDMQSGYCIDCDGQLQTPTTKTVKAGKIIRCKKCGRYNAPLDTHCSNRLCAAELETDCTATSQVEDQKTSIEYVLECPNCGHENPPSASVCEECNADLEFVDARQKVSGQAYIVNLITGARTKLENGVCHTIGKLHFLAEQLQSSGYVSGRHVDITWDGHQFILVDKSRNGTYILGRRLSPNTEIIVPNGTIIGLGDPSPDQPLAAFFKLEGHAD